MRKTICVLFLFMTASLHAEPFNVHYTNGSVTGITSVKADSFGDAKDIYESKNAGYIVFKVERYSGEPRSVEYMSYGQATDLARARNK